MCVNQLKSGVRGVSYDSSHTMEPVNSTSLDGLNWSMMPTSKCMSLQSASYSLAMTFLLEECVLLFTLA